MAALLLASCVASSRSAAPAAPAAPPAARDTHEQLDAVLWMQTAIEYRMLCEATYRAATTALAVALADPSWSAAAEQTGEAASLPPAVILDLDETVMDNSRFQGELVMRRSPYSSELWREWVGLRQAGLVPGAAGFLATARERGVATVFVTNRRLAEEADTVANLLALGVPVTAADILSLGENEWTSDKSERRRHVAATHRILLLIGDDLGDFIPARLSLERRAAAAEARAAWWGVRWFVLPNPLYGSWDRALTGFESGLSDRDSLLRKLQHVKGFTN